MFGRRSKANREAEAKRAAEQEERFHALRKGRKEEEQVAPERMFVESEILEVPFAEAVVLDPDDDSPIEEGVLVSMGDGAPEAPVDEMPAEVIEEAPEATEEVPQDVEPEPEPEPVPDEPSEALNPEPIDEAPVRPMDDSMVIEAEFEPERSAEPEPTPDENEYAPQEQADEEEIVIVDEEEEDEIVKAAKLVNLPNLVDYMFTLNLSNSMIINIALMLINTYPKYKNIPEEKKILVSCMKKMVEKLVERMSN